MKKKSVLIIAIVFIITLIGLFIINSEYLLLDYLNNKTKTSHHYIINITLNQSGNFILYVPLPLIWSKTEPHLTEVSDVVMKLETIYGDANISVIETEKGKALKISAHDSVKIEGHSFVQSSVLTNPLSLSVMNYTIRDKNREFWIYAEYNDNIEITLSIIFYVDGKYRSEEIDINGSLINGWQRVNGTYSGCIFN